MLNKCLSPLFGPAQPRIKNVRAQNCNGENLLKRNKRGVRFKTMKYNASRKLKVHLNSSVDIVFIHVFCSKYSMKIERFPEN